MLFGSGLPIIDPIENIKALFNRFNQFNLLKQCVEESPELGKRDKSLYEIFKDLYGNRIVLLYIEESLNCLSENKIFM